MYNIEEIWVQKESSLEGFYCFGYRGSPVQRGFTDLGIEGVQFRGVLLIWVQRESSLEGFTVLGIEGVQFRGILLFWVQRESSLEGFYYFGYRGSPVQRGFTDFLYSGSPVQRGFTVLCSTMLNSKHFSLLLRLTIDCHSNSIWDVFRWDNYRQILNQYHA